MKEPTSILITGGAGFIGSNFVLHYLQQNPTHTVVNLDSLTYAADKTYVAAAEKHTNYTFVEGDIRNADLIRHLLKHFSIDGIFHFAAESHVDNSISGPEAFVSTNVNGTFTLLEQARQYWMLKPFTFKEGFEHARFLHVSTDEVYGSLGKEGLFTETTPYAPNSPYSASKAASDMLVRSYYHTYGLNVVTTNCSNNYGPHQHDEKLIPTIIRKALHGEPIPIYGDGKNVRDWLYVADHCKGIALTFEKGKAGETYNIGGRNERENLHICNYICQQLDKLAPKDGSYADQITFVEDRAGHDRRYAIDASKIENELGWKADQTFETGITKTIEWYLSKYQSK